jgi:uncharacterized protein
MEFSAYCPPWGLNNGLTMTLYVALRAGQTWERRTQEPEPPYSPHIFLGANDVPIFGKVAIPANPRGTFVATYGITGTLENQWFLSILGRKAFAQGYAVVLFDWRAHGMTAQLSPTLTSDGLYEGDDFIHIAAQSKALGCPAPFWFSGYSLGGQLALWAMDAVQRLTERDSNGTTWGEALGLSSAEIGGGAVICPSLDSNRSLRYLMEHPLGKHLEKAIVRQLKKLAREFCQYHPTEFDASAVSRVNSIWAFDHEFVIARLGFASVEAYYEASSALPLLPQLGKPTLILYAEDDPLFAPAIVPELVEICATNPAIDLLLTPQGGHVGYVSSRASQYQAEDSDPWWAWNRVLEWCNAQSCIAPKVLAQPAAL